MRVQPGEGEGLHFHRNVQRFRGGLVFKAHILLYHSTLGLRVKKKKKEEDPHACDEIDAQGDVRRPLVHHQDAVRQHDHLRGRST